jgi:hypothetical protein
VHMTFTLRAAANPVTSSRTGCRQNRNCDSARLRASRDVMSDDALFNRIRCEFLEMPGLRLTRQQAQRLYGIEPTLCQRTLDRLVDTRFLCITSNGTYARLSDGADTPRPNPAKADLRARPCAEKVPA